MAAGLSDQQVGRLERSCTPRDWIRAASSRPGIERMEACFTRHAFAPHRHNTYAIGITLQGVQAFGYRGVARRSTSGQVFVLHPDELHDGRAGTEAGDRYRILYVEPHLIGEALGGPGTLPFVCDPISENPRLAAAIRPALADLNLSLEDLQQDQIVADLAQALAAADRSVPRKAPYTMDRPAMGRAREYLDARFE